MSGTWAYHDAAPPIVGRNGSGRTAAAAVAFPEPRVVADLEPPADVEDWIAEGAIRRNTLVLIAGPGGVGKTMLRKELELRAATGIGRLWGAFDVARSVPTLTLDEDNGEAEEYRRDEAYLASMGVERAALRRLYRASWSGIRLEQAPSQAWLRERIRALGIELLILDPVGQLYGVKEVREELLPVVKYLRALLVEFAALTIVLVHHVRKPSAGNGGAQLTLADVRGAEWADRADVVALVEGLGDRRVRVRLEKRIAPATLILEQGADGTFSFVAEGEQGARRRAADDRVLDAIDAGAEQIDVLVEATSIPRRTIFAALRRLRTRGILADGTPLRRLESE